MEFHVQFHVKFMMLRSYVKLGYLLRVRYSLKLNAIKGNFA